MIVGASAFCIPGAMLVRRNGLTQSVLPESEWNMANGQLRFPRNLGEPCSPLGEFPAGVPGYQLQALLAACLTESKHNERIRGTANGTWACMTETELRCWTSKRSRACEPSDRFETQRAFPLPASSSAKARSWPLEAESPNASRHAHKA